MSGEMLNKELLHLKQKLEILQSVYIFFVQSKAKESFQTSLLNQIEKDTSTLVSETSKLTVH